MRLFHIALRCLKEHFREFLVLLLTIVCAAFMVLLYKVFTYGGSTSYRVLVCSESGQQLSAKHKDLMDSIKSLKYSEDSSMVRVIPVVDENEGLRRLKKREADSLLILPMDISDALQKSRNGAPFPLRFKGDISSPYYLLSIIMAMGGVEGFVSQETGRKSLVSIREEAIGITGAKTEFDIYIPGILVFSIIILIFIASMAITKEYETGGLKRLRMTNATAFDILGGISLSVIVIGSLSLVCTFVMAKLLGFHYSGSLMTVFIICMITVLPVVGMGMMVAAFSKTVSQAFVIANFPLMILMFFSGAVYPMPKVELINLAGHSIGIYDFLPPTHAVSAMSKILTYGMGLKDLGYEICMLLLLSAVYFIMGVWLFRERRMKAS